MHFSTAIASTLLFASGALAQYGNYGSGSSNYGSGSSNSVSGAAAVAKDSGSGSSSSMSSSMSASMPMSTGTSSSGQVMVHVVKVSNKAGNLTFEPNNLQAAAGSMVQFHFYPKDHSVVQSTFDQPCQPIMNNMPSTVGFFSGFMPVKPDAAMMPSYTIMVNDTKPIWYYCSQGDHCQDGMVGVINPYVLLPRSLIKTFPLSLDNSHPADERNRPASNTSRTIDTFKTLAKSATENLSPGQMPSTSGSSDGDSDSPSASASAPAASGSIVTDTSGSTTGSTVTMPLSGTNSSTTGVAAPSGSAGGQAPQAFAGDAAGLGSSMLSILLGVIMVGVVGML
ncbi:MAG: hypothetical protein Q9220_004348 [cf. Caloplaca sp. 1 TL-2023]